MKFNSELLFRLGSAIGGVILDGKEGELAIPTQMAPTIEIPLPLRDLTGFDATVIQRSSWINDATLGKAASQGASATNLGTFSRGLWDVRGHLSGAANFNQTTDGTVQPNMILQLLDPDTITFGLLSLWSVANIQGVMHGRWRFLFVEDSWLVRLSVGATGVANTHAARASIVANRLH